QFRIVADLDLVTSLLIRSASARPSDPDLAHLTEAGEPVVPGSSIRGPFRARCAAIARLRMTEEKAEQLVAEIFGPQFKDLQAQRKDWLRAGPIRFFDSRLRGTAPKRQTRLAIDPFTGAAAETALYDEMAQWPMDPGPHMRLEITLDSEKCEHISLVLSAF